VAKGTKTKKDTDRLAQAQAKKVEKVSIADRELDVYKWNLKTSLRLAGKFGNLFTKVISNLQGENPLANVLRADFGTLFENSYEDVVEILAATIERENFESYAEAVAFVEELGLDEALTLFAVIGRQNIRPLVHATGNAAAEMRNVVGASAMPPKGSQPRT
jgi:hypothetical protein